MDAVEEMSAAVNSSLLVVISATTAAVSSVELEAFYNKKDTFLIVNSANTLYLPEQFDRDVW